MTTTSYTLSDNARKVTVIYEDTNEIVHTIILERGDLSFTQGDLEQLQALIAKRQARGVPGQRNVARRLFGSVLFHVRTGPPTWWLPVLEIRCDRVVLGWLRGMIALTWEKDEK